MGRSCIVSLFDMWWEKVLDCHFLTSLVETWRGRLLRSASWCVDFVLPVLGYRGFYLVEQMLQRWICWFRRLVVVIFWLNILHKGQVSTWVSDMVTEVENPSLLVLCFSSCEPLDNLVHLLKGRIALALVASL